MSDWRTILNELHLREPDARRVERAESILGEIHANSHYGDNPYEFLAHYHHTVQITAAGGQYTATCSCPDFVGTDKYPGGQGARGLACKHIVAVCMTLADRGSGLTDLGLNGVAPSASVTSAPTAPTPTAPATSPAIPAARHAARPPVTPPAPTMALLTAIGQAIGRLADRLGAYLIEGDSPLVLGPTGVGKTSAVHQVARQIQCGVEEIAGSESWTEADLIGCWTPAREWSWGPVGRAFRRAREGETVLVFVDEITRFNPRALDILLRAVQPVEAGLVRQMGVTIPDGVPAVFLAEAPLLGHRDWAPCDRLNWVAAGNPGVYALDPALVRRFTVLEATLDRGVLNALPKDVSAPVLAVWEAYERGEFPLPLEYQALARNGLQPQELFTRYHARVRALDRVAGEAVRRIVSGYSISIQNCKENP